MEVWTGLYALPVFHFEVLVRQQGSKGLIMNDAKIMEMMVAESDIRFIDSLNFLPMPLSKFPKTFGLPELAFL